jgi:trimeric autotransporter adhesin
MSSDQRYAVYVLASTDGATEVPGSTQNIFVSDTCLGVASGCTPSTTLVSTGMSGTLANGDSISPSITAGASADGRYVSFLSSATNLVASDTNGAADAFVRDTCAGGSSGCTPSTQLVSVTTSGTQANGATTSATIDATGRYITFESQASNLGSISSSGGIFLRDTCAGAPAGCAPSTQPLN